MYHLDMLLNLRHDAGSDCLPVYRARSLFFFANVIVAADDDTDETCSQLFLTVIFREVITKKTQHFIKLFHKKGAPPLPYL